MFRIGPGDFKTGRAAASLAGVLALAGAALLPASAAAQAPNGGPDAGGYTYADSTAPGGPAYNYIDISETGADVLTQGGSELFDDSVSTDIPIGFDFEFYGQTYSTVRVSSNGFVSFQPGLPGSACCSGQSIPQPGSQFDPDGDSPDALIASWWQDLVGPGTSGEGAIRHETIGEAPNRVFIVDYSDILLYQTWNSGGEGEEPLTMQVQLFEGSNIIEVHYEELSFEFFDEEFFDVQPVAAGIESETGLEGLEYFYGFEELDTPLTVRYVPGLPEDCDMNETPDILELQSMGYLGYLDGNIVITADDRLTSPTEELGDGGGVEPESIVVPIGSAPDNITGLDFDGDGRLWATEGAFQGGVDVSRGPRGETFASHLLELDPLDGSILADIGPIYQDVDTFTSPVDVLDLAVQPGTNDIYVTGYDFDFNFIGIFRVDPLTADADLYAVTPETEGGGLAFDKDGRLFMGGLSVIHEIVPPGTPDVTFGDPDFGVVLRTADPFGGGFFFVDNLGYNIANNKLAFIDGFGDTNGGTYFIDPDSLDGQFVSRLYAQSSFLSGAPVGDITFLPSGLDLNGNGIIDICEFEDGDCEFLGQVRLESVGEFDGTVIENTSDDPALPPVGRSVRNGSVGSQVGDDNINARTVGIYHFDLTGLDNVSGYSSGYLRFTLLARSGLPEDAFGMLAADLKIGAFGDDPELVASDFEAPADMTLAGMIAPGDLEDVPRGGSVFLPLDPAVMAVLQGAESVQVRVYFPGSSDGDSDSEFLTLPTGEYGENHPYTPEMVLTYLPISCDDCLANPFEGQEPDGQNPPRFVETEMFTSIASQDGDVGETVEQAEVGYRRQDRSFAFNVGDNRNAAQTVGILSFDTSSIPANAIVTSADVMLRRVGGQGDTTGFGELYIDLTCPEFSPFGASEDVGVDDFEAWTSFPAAAIVPYPASPGDIVVAPVDPIALGAINRNGLTQAKVRFELPSDGDTRTDVLTFYTGEQRREEYRPALIVNYTMPLRGGTVMPGGTQPPEFLGGGQGPTGTHDNGGGSIETIIGNVRDTIRVEDLDQTEFRRF